MHMSTKQRLAGTVGYLVSDARGRIVGHVEGPMYGASRDVPDALSVRGGFLSRRRRLVRVDAISRIDKGARVVGLRIPREDVHTFL
jgi:hypothetical protein